MPDGALVTVPPPLTVTLTACVVAGPNATPTLRSPSSPRVHDDNVPQPSTPLHAATRQPSAGTAVSVTVVPYGTLRPHAPGQLRPGPPTTEPLPLTATVRATGPGAAIG